MNWSELFHNGGIYLHGALALGPVLVFLIALTWFDSRHLIRRRFVVGALLAGTATGLLGYLANTSVLAWTGMPTLVFAIGIAPLIEESLKGAFVYWCLRTGRAAFLVDAAILGFAAGAGFSVLENLYYLKLLPEAPLIVWIIRGFGTAMMHGGCTAVFAVLVRSIRSSVSPSRRSARTIRILLALLLAAALHAGFNRSMVQPVWTTIGTVVLMPLIFTLVYRRSERVLRHWVGAGFDRDQELLGLIRSGGIASTPLGRELSALRSTFSGEAVADMLCLLRLQAEISIAVKGRLLLQEHGLEPVSEMQAGRELAERMEEAAWLEKSVGRAGLLALRPLGAGWDRKRWERRFLRRGHTATGSGPNRPDDDPVENRAAGRNDAGSSGSE